MMWVYRHTLPHAHIAKSLRTNPDRCVKRLFEVGYNDVQLQEAGQSNALGSGGNFFQYNKNSIYISQQ